MEDTASFHLWYFLILFALTVILIRSVWNESLATAPFRAVFAFGIGTLMVIEFFVALFLNWASWMCNC